MVGGTMTLTEAGKDDSCSVSAADVSDKFIVQQVGTQQVLCKSDFNDPMNAREARIELLKAKVRIALVTAFKANIVRFSCKLKGPEDRERLSRTSPQKSQ